MNLPKFLPLLSEYDPPLKAEGSLDPLGMYAIADAMGVRLAPGVRERQGVPRFLTLMAVSLFLCERFDSEVVASDGVSEPWQVFEWYVIEGLVRRLKTDDQIRGLPGRDKARAALDDNVPLSADRYLKTPTVFGFHGVYRTLAREIGVESAGRLGELGYELLKTWCNEQGLPGFLSSSGGAGAAERAMLEDAVRDGMAKGAVARRAGWQGWAFIADHLAPHQIGRGEATALHEALLGDQQGFRGRLLRELVSDQGQGVWSEGASERRFHSHLLYVASPEMKLLIQAIMAYEVFSRLLQDAFDDSRLLMTRSGRKVRSEELAEMEGVRRAATEIPTRFEEARARLDELELGYRFDEQFATLAEPSTVGGWAVRLMEHHVRIQQRKSPAGKAPWIELFDDGGYMIRPAYRVETGGSHDGEYVHAYRTAPLWSFSMDLGIVNK